MLRFFGATCRRFGLLQAIIILAPRKVTILSQ